MKRIIFIAFLFFACFLMAERQKSFTTVLAQKEAGDIVETSIGDEQSRISDRQLGQVIRQLTDRSTEGLTQTDLSGIGTLTDLQGRFLNVMLARIGTDGEPVAACVTSVDEANHFFGRNLETGEAVAQTPFNKEDTATVAARHGMNEREFVFYSEMIAQATLQEQLMSPATATISIVTSGDTAGEGFNDSTAKAAEGGNTGTLGQQRLNLFNHAAQQIWGIYLDSAAPTRIYARFDPITPCSNGSGVLGSAGSNFSIADFPGAEYANTEYHIALADKQYGSDILAPAQNHISATINSSIDTGCLGTGTRFYYGLDNATPSGTTNLLIVLLHELGHGLGFSSFVNGTTGVYATGRPDIYSRFMLDEDTGLLWANMTNAQRITSATNTNDVVWNGANVRIASVGYLTAGFGSLSGSVNLYTPNLFESGSSISHFSTAATQNLLMEPAINSGLPTDLDLTRQQMRDIGWYRDTTNNTSRDEITGVTPNSGVKVVGTTVPITWTNTEGFNRSVTIELSKDGGVTYPLVIAASVSNTGSYTSWTVPVGSATTQARIRVREVGYADPSGISSANFTIAATAPTSATVSITGRIADANSRGISGATINLIDLNGNLRTAQSNPFGYFRIKEVPVGATYFADVRHKRHRFTTQVINLNEAMELNFTPVIKQELKTDNKR